ncbi:MAG: hypothetical protein J5814_03340 [Bacteroidaceae bacterium]|nr:hypothetical protein [Bacteroidaceae bacterium]
MKKDKKFFPSRKKFLGKEKIFFKKKKKRHEQSMLLSAGKSLPARQRRAQEKKMNSF